MSGVPARAVLALDNSGTLSRTTVVDEQVVSGDGWDRPVPDMDGDTPVALVSVDHDHVGAFDTEEAIGAVVASGEVPLYVSLSSVDCTAERARAALATDLETPSRSLVTCVERALERTDGTPGVADAGGLDAAAAGAQLVVDLDACRVVRVIGYTATPLAGARAVVERATAVGFVPHIVSGDTTHILQRVASDVGIDIENVHAYQTPEEKGTTIERLRERSGLPVVMVGDHVNDRFAFEMADVAIFVDDEGSETARATLGPIADVKIPHLSALPETLDDWLGTEP